jgi:hypothetical protein
LLCSAAVRASYDDAPEQRCNGGSHYRGIELDDAEEHPSKHKTATRHGNPRNQDQFATARNFSSELFNALLKAHDLVICVAPVVMIQVECSRKISARLDLKCFLERSLNDAPINTAYP